MTDVAYGTVFVDIAYKSTHYFLYIVKLPPAIISAACRPRKVIVASGIEQQAKCGITGFHPESLIANSLSNGDIFQNIYDA